MSKKISYLFSHISDVTDMSLPTPITNKELTPLFLKDILGRPPDFGSEKRRNPFQKGNTI
jgi:hypothetical protein